MTTEQRGLITPFQRDRQRDFASGTGPELLRSKVLQVILTRGATPTSAGELPWRTNFGAGLDLLRHGRNDHALAELARVQIREALAKWLPEVEVVEVTAVRDGAALQLKVRFRERQRPTGDPSEVQATVPG